MDYPDTKEYPQPYQKSIKRSDFFWNFFSELRLIMSLLVVDPAICVIN
jgi:hypothetical protein